MKINSVHLASFGKFKNYTLNFSDGFNVIFGENEKGKTTIMAFIRMMFYGTSGKSSDTAKNLRKKYMPFDSDLMAGSIDFEHKGVSYTLERVFKASNAADKLKLINHNTGEINSTSGKTDIGSAFFGLSDSAFEKSVYTEAHYPVSKVVERTLVLFKVGGRESVAHYHIHLTV